ncbi:hypothetical protein Barb4_01044 [Bacteroidales bacterium Barb4]|nr:hypothetical protein Barb4_01044 [Bacteroidales bacterium Barb4]
MNLRGIGKSLKFARFFGLLAPLRPRIHIKQVDEQGKYIQGRD